MRAPRPLLLIAALWGIACFPGYAAAAPGYDDAEETDSLPSYAEEEWDQAQGAVSADDYGDAANSLPAPPNEISQPRGASGPQMQAQMQAVPAADAERPGVTFDDFYAGLADQGNWVETPEYGYVFIPYRQAHVSGWRPYTYGRWVWTSYGWTWASDEPFGWATYHYGRWAFVGGYGWAWVPGYTWGPAWVAWRYGDAAIGWAPLYPGYVVYSASYPVYYDHWVFIGPRYFYGYPVHHHHYGWHDSHHYYSSTSWAHNWRDPRSSGTVYAGPPRGYVERHGGTAVRTTRLQSVSRPGEVRSVSGNGAPDRMSFYRPDARGARRPSAGSSVKAPRNVRTPQNVGSGLVSAQRPGRYELAPTAREAGNRSDRFGGRTNGRSNDGAAPGRSGNGRGALSPTQRSDRLQPSGNLRDRSNGPGRSPQPGSAPGRSVPPSVRQPSSRGMPQAQPPAQPAPPRKSKSKQNEERDRSVGPRSVGPRPGAPSPAPSLRGGGREQSGPARGGSRGGGHAQGFGSSSSSRFNAGSAGRFSSGHFSGGPSFGGRTAAPSIGSVGGHGKRSSGGSIRRGH